MKYRFYTTDHPEACGRTPKNGEESFHLYFATDENGRLDVFLGRRAFVNVASCILAGLRDDSVLAEEVARAVSQIGRDEK